MPEVESVYQPLGEQQAVIYIKGAMSLRQGLQEQLEANKQARYFMYQQEPIYTQRESELLQ